MKSIPIFFVIFVWCYTLSAQITPIHTGTATVLGQIEANGTDIYINGKEGFLAKCTGNCDSLILLNHPDSSGKSFNDLQIVDSVMYLYSSDLIYGESEIYKSVDLGNSWQMVFDTTNLYLTALVMFNSKDGFALSTARRLVRTDDSWGKSTKGLHVLPIVSAVEKFKDSTVCIGIIDDFCISRDRGFTWDCKGFAQANPNKFFYLNSDTLLAVSGSNHGNFFSRTYNSGKTWKHTGISMSPFGLYFKTNYEGYVVGSSGNRGVIMKTTDAGESWQTYITPYASILLDIHFMNDSIALISGTGGVLFKWNKNTAQFISSVTDVQEHTVSITISPNPATDNQTVVLHLQKTAEIAIELYDMHGRPVKSIYKGNAPKGESKFSHETSGLPVGTYIYKIDIEGQQYFRKMMKVH